MKLYIESALTLIILITSAVLDGYLKTAGLFIGIIVGILTILKIWKDYRLKKIEIELKEIELKKHKRFKHHHEKND